MSRFKNTLYCIFRGGNEAMDLKFHLEEEKKNAQKCKSDKLRCAFAFSPLNKIHLVPLEFTTDAAIQNDEWNQEHVMSTTLQTQQSLEAQQQPLWGHDELRH